MSLSRRQLFTAAGFAVLAGGATSNGPAAAAAPVRTWSGEIQVAEWERYHLGLDGGAHQKALSALGIAHRDGGNTASQPRSCSYSSSVMW